MFTSRITYLLDIFSGSLKLHTHSFFVPPPTVLYCSVFHVHSMKKYLHDVHTSTYQLPHSVATYFMHLAIKKSTRFFKNDRISKKLCRQLHFHTKAAKICIIQRGVGMMAAAIQAKDGRQKGRPRQQGLLGNGYRFPQ